MTLTSNSGQIRATEGLSASGALELDAFEFISINSATSTTANVELRVRELGADGYILVSRDIVAKKEVILDTQGQVVVRKVKSTGSSGGGITIGNSLTSFVVAKGKLVARSGDVSVKEKGLFACEILMPTRVLLLLYQKRVVSISVTI